MCGDAIQPAAQHFGIAQRVAPRMRPQKSLLREILGFRRLTDYAQNIAIDLVVVRSPSTP